MPINIVTGAVVRCRAVCSQGSQVAVNVRYFEVTGHTGIGGTDADLAAILATNLAPLYKAMMCSTATFRGVGAQIVIPAPTKVEQVSINGQGPGTVVGEPLPPQICGLVRYRSDIAGPAGRAFIYVPFPGENDSSLNGSPTAAYQAAGDLLGQEWNEVRTVGAGADTSAVRAIIYNVKTFAKTIMSSPKTKVYWSQQKRRSYLRKGDAIPV